VDLPRHSACPHREFIDRPGGHLKEAAVSRDRQ
jgi:hypothetical protein